MIKGKIFFNTLINQLYTWVKSRKHIFFLLALLSVVYWKWWEKGLRVANDFPAVSQQDLRVQFAAPQLWLSKGAVGLGQYSVFTLWSWLLDFIVGAFAHVGLTFEILERGMFIIPTLLLGTYGIWRLLAEFGLSKTSKLIAALFYLANTYILLLIDGGQLGIGLAYAWFPLSYFLFTKSVDGKFKNKLIAGLGLWILGLFDIRFIFILAILLLLRFLYESVFLGNENRKKRIIGWIKSGIIAVLIFAALNAFWIMPYISYPLPDTKIAALTKSSSLNFTQLKNSISLLQPHWYENIFGKIAPFRKEFLLIPILAFLAVVVKRKSKEVWFWVGVATVSIFLTKGANTPLPRVYPWLFDNIPGFSLFRDSTKFFFLVALSYSVLTAFTIDAIIRKFPNLKLTFPLIVAGYYLFLISPVFTGKMTGTFSTPRYESEYSKATDLFENDKSFGRVLWVPSRTPLSYASPLHSSLEASRLESLRPFAISTVGTYETQNFIREGNYMGELFDIAGIEYLAYPYFDPKRDDMSKEKVDYYNTFLNQIENLPWVGKMISDIPIPVFETKENKSKFFVSGNTYFVVGSDRIYSEIKDLGGKFSDTALVFTEETPDTIGQIDKLQTAKIVLYDKNISDLALSFVENDKFISPSLNLDFSPNITGWWKREASDLVWTHDFLQQKYGIDNLDFDYGQGWAIAEQNKTLNIKNEKLETGSILYARIMQSSKGGEVGFYQNDSLMGSVDTKIEKPEVVTIKLTGSKDVPDRFDKYNKADFHWVRVGEIMEDGGLTIKTKGDVNIVNSLAVVSPSSERFINEKILNLKESGRIVLWDGLDTKGKKELLGGANGAEVTYTTFAPIHYKVKIEGLDGPTTLFFSETFDGGWELNKEKGYKLYSLINGFWIAENGEYDLYFTPQKYVIPGLIVSGITLTSCIIYLAWKRKQPISLSKTSS